MTMTDEDLENRLRRDLAELAALPAHAPRERRAGRRTRPALTMVVALAVVLALVAASVAVVRSTQNRASRPAAVPTVQTILEQPSSMTGSSSSIVATPFSQVCEHWRELPAGVDCTDLQARYVWSPGAKKGPVTFSAIEVVGRPDLKLAQDGATKDAYPISETVLVRGHRARLFGGPAAGGEGVAAVTMVWNERADLQVWIHVAGDPSLSRLTNTIVAFARGMRPVPIDPAKTTYAVKRS